MEIVRQTFIDVVLGSRRWDVRRDSEVDIAEQKEDGDGPTGFDGRVPGVNLCRVWRGGWVRTAPVEGEESDRYKYVDDTQWI